ncbi:MAG: hypothetical protein L0Y64_11240 [Myxococcaceae bacterium]|nr:hypothetical protein [Myxococcaceae bacterium]
MEIPRISLQDVRERLERGEHVTFLDTRNPKAWGESDRKLPGAIRVPSDAIEENLPSERLQEPIVAYCT